MERDMVDVEYLRQRAEEFLETAKYNFSKGYYNLAAFCVEQYIQLYLKYFLAKTVGYYPRTHSLSVLLSEAGKICPEFVNFYSRRALELSSVEDAYITSRYVPREFDTKTVEAMLKLAEEFGEVMEKCLQP